MYANTKLLVSFCIQSDMILWQKKCTEKKRSAVLYGNNTIKIPHEVTVGCTAKACIILKPTSSLVQMSAQWGYYLIFQPSEYLLIWTISLAGWFHWPLSPWSPLFTWTLIVAIRVYIYIEISKPRQYWLIRRISLVGWYDWTNEQIWAFSFSCYNLGWWVELSKLFSGKISELIFFQLSAQWGYNLIFQPSDYLLIWRKSLVV